MSREELFRLFKAHNDKHPGLLWVVFRAFCYSVGLLLTMKACDAYFGDTYLANLSLFTLYSTVLELLLDRCCDWKRCFLYVITLVGLFVTGILMVQQASAVQKDCPAAVKHMEKK